MVNPKCCNPFNLKNHKNLKDKSRAVSVKLAENAKTFLNREITGERVCEKCSRKLYNLKEIQILTNLPIEATSCASSDISPGQSEKISPSSEITKRALQEQLSEACVQLGGSPIKKKRLSEIGYCRKQVEKVIKVTCENVLGIPVPKISHIEDINQPDLDDDKAVPLSNIVEAYNREEKYEIRVFLLSLLPEKWSTVRIMNQFKATQYMVLKAKNLASQNGYGSFPGLRKMRPGISVETINLVEEFYRCPNISQQLPGANDYVSIRDVNGARTHKQKLLVLCSLSEAYNTFLEKHPAESIGFSKFAELRPKECILAGRPGTHNVCVCIIHQNINLLCPVISKIMQLDIRSERVLLQYVSCKNVSWTCCEGKCEQCNAQHDKFLEGLKATAEAENVEEVTYSYWISDINTYKLEKITTPIEEIIEILSDSSKFSLAALRKHDYIAREQSNYLQIVKSNLQDGEYAVILDFSENYKFVTQNEIQAAHYYTQQATLFPIVAYYKAAPDKQNIISYAIISEEETHDTVAVYGFQKKFIEFLENKKSVYPAPKKIYYFSDGAVSQFKNKKNFTNINHHEMDFKVDCEWNFFATSHGKGPSDGVGGTIKRLARSASLRSVAESLFNNSKEFFDWCKEKSDIKSIHFDYVTKAEYAKTEKYLNKRFSKLKTVDNTRQIHQVMPTFDKKCIKTKIYSNSDIVNKCSLY